MGLEEFARDLTPACVVTSRDKGYEERRQRARRGWDRNPI